MLESFFGQPTYVDGTFRIFQIEINLHITAHPLATPAPWKVTSLVLTFYSTSEVVTVQPQAGDGAGKRRGSPSKRPKLLGKGT